MNAVINNPHLAAKAPANEAALLGFDAPSVRAQFPILSRKINGQPLAFLDSAASAQKPQIVIDAMAHMMSHSYANVHRGLYQLANEATEAFEHARNMVARFIGASANEVVFTKGATEGLNLLATTIGQRLVAGDEIILSDGEHHANIVPWHMLATAKGVVLRFVPLSADGQLDLTALAEMAGPRTKIIALTAMSNVLGTTPDWTAISQIGADCGAILIADCCQAAVHGHVDVRTLGADAIVFSGHKLYGPTGIGALWMRPELAQSLPPYQGGGEMIETVTREKVTFQAPPHRFEAGTPAIIEAHGLGVALEWLMGFDRAKIVAHEQGLAQKLADGLADLGGVEIFGTAPKKGPIVSFALKGAHPHDVAQLLDAQGVAVRAGTHCAQILMASLGQLGTVRASIGIYNNDADIDQFLAAMAKAKKMLVGA